MERIRFATISVFGLGGLVALAVAVTLYVSGAAGLRTTQNLLAEQSESLLDTIERRLDRLLEPIADQGIWIAEAFERGQIGLAEPKVLDAFMIGALGATPQVSSLGIGTPDARLRTWSRETTERRELDWSDRRSFVNWIESGATRDAPSWRPPIWGQVSRSAVLLHDVPLRRDGVYLGMLSQVVPVAGLSRDLAQVGLANGVTPFVVYAGDRLLAHPALRSADTAARNAADPMPRLSEFGDPVLARLYAPDAPRLFGLNSVASGEVSEIQVEGKRYLVVYRTIGRFGPEPWIVGAYVDVEESGLSADMRRLVQGLLAGLGVLVLAVLVAVIVGRRLSRPVRTFSRAARAVRLGDLDNVPVLERSAIKEFDEASRSFNEMVKRLRERSMIRATLGRFVSEQVATELLSSGGRIEPTQAEATVLVCDVEEFTVLTESLGPVRVVEFLNAYFEAMVGIVERRGGVITQFQGDAILAVFNVPLSDAQHAQHAVEAAVEMAAAADSQRFAGVQARNRIGICTGQVVAGAVGARGRLSYTVHGNAVNMAARLEVMNKDFGTRVLVSSHTVARCTSVAFDPVARAEIRGYHDLVELFTPRGSVRA